VLRNDSYIFATNIFVPRKMMNQKKQIRPTDAELEILQVLWEHGPSTVRQVNERMNLDKKVGYTTTLKLLQIMTEKGITLRDQVERIHIYSPAVEMSETRSQLLDRFVDTAFGGSAMSLVMQALGNHKASNEEMTQIKEILMKMEEENNDRDTE
jgi:BlaI family transcriptional regulator, penicillinase repressor